MISISEVLFFTSKELNYVPFWLKVTLLFSIFFRKVAHFTEEVCLQLCFLFWLIINVLFLELAG
jgi:hypothetical protein